jgi:hypothetical protein
MAIPTYSCDFTSHLIRFPGKGGWVFAPVPAEHAPTTTQGWGRTPVVATVDGMTWNTSVWREKSGRTMLAIPKKVRRENDHDDTVHVRIEYSIVYRS